MTSQAPFILGCNYWPRHTGPRMWRDFDPQAIAQELQWLRQSGLQVVRAFCFWPDFMPTMQRVEPLMLQRLRTFMQLCEHAGMGVYLTPLVGHMSGENWPPVWLHDASALYHDETLLQVQELYVGTVVQTVSDSPALFGHILSNEMPLFAGSGTVPTVRHWAHRLVSAVRRHDPSHPISLGDGVWSLWGEETGFRPGHAQDFLGLHMYPSDSDPLRHTFAFGLNTRMAAMHGKPVLMEEFGAQHTVFGEEEVAGFAASVLFESWANGASGALWWCGFDFDLPQDLPYSHHPFELVFGMHDAHGRAKAVAHTYARFAQALPLLGRPAPTQVALLLPSYLNHRYPFSWDDRDGMKRATQQAFALARMAGAQVCTFQESASDREHPGGPALRLPEVPVVYGGAVQKLRAATWAALSAWVQQGGHFVMGFDFGANEVHVGTWHADLPGFFGVRGRMRYGLTAPAPRRICLLKALGDLPAGLEWELPVVDNPWHATPLQADALDAEVLACDDQGQACLWRCQRGQGTVWLLGYPVEHAAQWSAVDYAHHSRLLRAIFSEAGAALAPAQPVGVVGQGSDAVQAWMNHQWTPQPVQLPPGVWRASDGGLVQGVVELAPKQWGVWSRVQGGEYGRD